MQKEAKFVYWAGVNLPGAESYGKRRFFPKQGRHRVQPDRIPVPILYLPGGLAQATVPRL